MKSVSSLSNRLLFLLFFLISMLTAKTALSLPAFPEAEGFGSDTVGGRGGTVYTVTTLDWSGPGSFAEALYERTGPRTIVFAVSGVIVVPEYHDYELTAEHSYVTVAGQTSPGGITFQMSGAGSIALWSYNLSNNAAVTDDQQFHDAIFRHLHFRGVANTDNVSLAGVHNIVFDHCDFSGADDEALDITYAHDVTIQNSTITNSGRSSGENSKYGFLLAYPPSDNLSFHHNLTANHGDRCGAHIHWENGGTPDGGADIDIRNNVMYNCWHESFFYPSTDTQPQHQVRLNFVGNTMLVGPDSSGPGNVHSTTGMLGFYRQSTSVYATDNVFPDEQFSGGQRPLFVEGYSTPTLVSTAFDYDGEHANVTTQSVAVAQTLVMDTAGAWPRDNMNQRTIDEINTKTGSLGNSSATLTTATPAIPTDSDGDGMADSWEQQHGLQVGSNDANGDSDGDGYTNLENYLNELAGEVTGACSATANGQGLACRANGTPDYNVSGAWYDPDYDGSGFVIVQTPVGTGFSFYGYKGSGNGREQWLTSELISGTALEQGRTYTVNMRSGYPGNGGTFSSKPNLPTADGDGTQDWGTLSIRFDSCTRGQATLTDTNSSDGNDGSVTMALQRIAGINHIDCDNGSSAASGFYLSGAWYDPKFNGSGFFMSETSAGLLSAFYGYTGSGDGDAFWLISDPSSASETIELNTHYLFVMRSGFIGNGGSFTSKPNPAPGTKQWGNMDLIFHSCNRATLTLTDTDSSDGDDGSHTFELTPLGGIEGLNCTEPEQQAENKDSPFGISASSLNYYMTEYTLIDSFKQSGKWLTQDSNANNNDGWDSEEQDLIDLDANGWPKSLNGKNGASVRFNQLAKLIHHGSISDHPAGDYIVLYEGEGELAYGFGLQKDASLSTPGRDVLHLSRDEPLMVIIRSTDPNNTGDYLRNIQVIKPGGICNGDPYALAATAADCNGTFTALEEIAETQVFHPTFLNELKHYGVLRGMVMQETPTNTYSTWDTRPKVTDASWANQGKGMPFELIIKYANLTGTDAWVNLAAKVDDDYVTKMATYIKNNLNQDRKVYIEYFDEAWNTWGSYYEYGGQWMGEQGRARWGNSISGFEAILNWYGMRTSQICQMFKDTFAGDADRVKCTMNSQAANTWVSEQMLGCPVHVAAGGERCANNIDYLSIAPYFGGYLGEAGENNAYANVIQNWTLDDVFTEFTQGGIFPNSEHSGGALAESKRWMVASKAVADNFGVDLIAYEGGQHLMSLAADGDVKDRITDLFVAANKDSRMHDMYIQHFQDWRDAGGLLFVAFESVTPYGDMAWGNKQYHDQDPAPKAQAVIDFQNANPCWWDDCQLQ